MTNEEAINLFCFSDWIQCLKMPKADLERIAEAMSIVGKICINQSAYIDREQVEKAWTAEWRVDEFGHKCSKCGEYLPDGEDVRKPQFCPECGRAMTDEAVDMAMERMEALHENRD